MNIALQGTHSLTIQKESIKHVHISNSLITMNVESTLTIEDANFVIE